MTEPKKCKRGDCQIEAQESPFGGHYAICRTCRKSARAMSTAESAMAEWNRWVEIGGFIDVDKSTPAAR